MTPDRLDQISRIFHEALARSEGERGAFLSEASRQTASAS